MGRTTKEIVETAGATVGEATKEIINKSFALLDQLAAKIGVTTEYLWPFIIKESIVQALTSILLFVVSVIGIFFSYKFIKLTDFSSINSMREKKENGMEHLPKTIIAMTATGILIISAMVGFCHTWNNLPGLLNPEYHALERLINMVK